MFWMYFVSSDNQESVWPVNVAAFDQWKTSTPGPDAMKRHTTSNETFFQNRPPVDMAWKRLSQVSPD